MGVYHVKSNHLSKNYFQDKQGMGFLFVTILFLTISLSSQTVFAQKSDYAILNDTVYRQGKISDLPTEGNTVIFFKSSAKSDPERLTVDEVKEFSYKERLFFRRQIQVGDSEAQVFLERLPVVNTKATLWKLNGPEHRFFVETDGELISLQPKGYRETLSNIFEKPELSSLIRTTQLNEFQLNYLFRTAENITKPRSFSKTIVFMPNVGFGMIRYSFVLPENFQNISLSGSSPVVGLSIETFINFKRSLSLNFSPTWSNFRSHTFESFIARNGRVESDVNIGFSTVQLPFFAKYYHDIQANKSRVFVELGYNFAFSSFRTARVFEAKISGNTVLTSQKSLELPEKHQGIVGGVGFEKFLNNHRVLVLGFRGTFLSETLESKITQTHLFAGYKF